MGVESSSATSRMLSFLYGAIVYVFFLGTFCYAAGFVGDLVVPKTVDRGGTVGPVGQAMLINALLLVLFVVQHTIMARPGFKAWWTRSVPKQIERSTFVLFTCVTLCLMYWQWRPMPETVWSVESAAARTVLYGLFGFGWVLVLYSSFCIDHFDLFGLRQVVLHVRGREYTSPGFSMPVLYKLVRNPLMLGFLIAFWATPHMTQGHLMYSVLTTGYIFMGIAFEERDLLGALGNDYRRYRARTPMILPLPRPRARTETAEA